MGAKDYSPDSHKGTLQVLYFEHHCFGTRTVEHEALGEESIETVTQEDQLSQPLDNALAPRAGVSTSHADGLAFSVCYT